MNVSERGERAGQILDSDVFKAATEEAHEALIAEWILCDNAAGREALWHKYHALDGLPRQLRIFRDRAKTEEKRSG